MVVVVIDTSIKDQVAISIWHVYSHNRLIIKTIYHSVNVTSTEAKLFAIRYSINQATHLLNTNHIFAIMDSIHAAKRIFDSLSYLYQIYSAVIYGKPKEFFHKDNNNFIEFLDCLSNCKWSLHDIVDKETKKFDLTPILLYKSL